MTTTLPSLPPPPEHGEVEGTARAGGSAGRRAKSGRVLGAVIGAHAVVDYYSFIVVALLPLLAVRLDLTNPQKAYILATGSIASGFLQPLVAWIGDRLNTRVIATIGLVVAAATCTTIGLAQNFWQLLVLTAVSAAAVGAFHPPAAAVVGQMSGSRRALGVSLFFLSGMAGGMLGNVLSPYVVLWLGQAAGGEGAAADLTARGRTIGLGLAWQSALVVPGLLVAVVLARAIHAAPHRTASAHAVHAALPFALRQERWKAVWLLYAANVTRFVVNTALVYLFVRWIEIYAAERHGAGVGAVSGAVVPGAVVPGVGIAASVLNGKFQAAMQLGMGAAGLAAGWLLSKRHEKASMVLVPIMGAASIAAMPWVDDLGLGSRGMIAAGLVLAVLSGMGFGGTTPTVIALAQRLLPHRTALASGLMMGGAWGFGFLGPPIAERIEAWVSLDAAFFATAGMLLVTAVLAAVLPGRVLREA
jgi:MFS family permease